MPNILDQWERMLSKKEAEVEQLRGDLEDFQRILFGDPGECRHDDPVWVERVQIGHALEAILQGVYRRAGRDSDA